MTGTPMWNAVSTILRRGRSPTCRGGRSWRRCDGQRLVQIQTRLPFQWRSARTVLDLIERPGGAVWWRANGRGYDGTFDLRPGSRSWQVFQAYTVGKGIAI